MFDLTGRVVVVSGASSGLGAQMARGFAEQGADLVITARRMDKLQALAKELEEKGFITIRGRVSRQYFEERIYGVRKEEQKYASV